MGKTIKVYVVQPYTTEVFAVDVRAFSPRYV